VEIRDTVQIQKEKAVEYLIVGIFLFHIHILVKKNPTERLWFWIPANTWNLGKVHVRFVYPKVFHGAKTGDI